MPSRNAASLAMILDDDAAPEFLGDLGELSIGGPKLFGGTSPYSSGGPVAGGNMFDSFVALSQTPAYRPSPTYIPPAPVYQFMNAPQASLQQPTTTAGHSTRDQVLTVANRGLDFLTQYFASKGQLSTGAMVATPAGYVPGSSEGNAGGVQTPSGAGSAVGTGLGSIVEGVTNWVSANTGLTLLIGAGIALWLKQSPRKGR